MESTFKFFCPITLSKAKDKEGNTIMRLGGIASTMDEDSDGEFLDPAGFDISEFKKSGVVNWHHQTKNSPLAIIGEPHKAEIRKDGFYVECDLYADSKLAQEVYETAEIMGKNSKTRRLGYSIEGTIVEKDPDNPKIIKKAVITGLAVTHMPKNAKTFADIIKGKSSEIEEKSMTTESAAPLKKESVSGKYRMKKMSADERRNKILDTYTGISIEKANKVNDLLIKIEQKMAEKEIKDEDIEKAMGILGLDLKQNPFIEKAKRTPNQVADAVTKRMFDEDLEDIDEEATEKNKKTTMKKSVDENDANAIKKAKTDLVRKTVEENRILKAIGEMGVQSSTQVKALGTLVKAQINQIGELEKGFAEIKKDFSDTREELMKANSLIEELSGQSNGRKSITTTSFKERNFEGEIKKGNDVASLSASRDYNKVLNLMDNMSIEKGYDSEMGKATSSFEISKTIPQNIVQRIKLEKGITIVE